MKAESDGNAGPWIKYVHCDWGDLIYGTKRQLQALGLGVGLKYPEEAGGPRLELKVRHFRGDAVTIDRRYEQREGVYVAHVRFPNWPEAPSICGAWSEFAAGVVRRECPRADEYRGSADDLVAAGLVQAGHFPGMPGMRRTKVIVRPDGSIPAVHRNTSHVPGMNDPGAKRITRSSVSSYTVEVWIPEAESDRRLAAACAKHESWRRHVQSLPRPPKLAPRPAAYLDRFMAAHSRAMRDEGFQAMLNSLISGAAGRRGTDHAT